MLFFIEVALSGLMAGVMYSLVALGFVLIFKASGIFNFAQGVMALFAALTLVGLMEKPELHRARSFSMPQLRFVNKCTTNVLN